MAEIAPEAEPVEDELEPETNDEALEVEATEDEGDPSAWDGVAPPDRKLITQPVDLAVSVLVAQVDQGDLHLSPVYQRRYVWDNKKASKLIESLLINVPIPVCYLAEEADGSRSTIDGQQRLRSLHRFLQNEFALRGLEVLPEVNGRRFFQLTQRQQRLIKNRTIRCIVISEESHPDIRFDVFERLNTGSVALTAQELRNSVYRGSLNALLHELAEGDTFKACLNNRADARMTFEELVLRFFALDEALPSYRPSLKLFLNNYMRDQRSPDEDVLNAKRARFERTIARVFEVYGGNSFRRTYRENGEHRLSPAINSALYDAVMLNFARVERSAEEFADERERIHGMTENLMLENADFIDAISLATGDRARLRRRVRIFAENLAILGFDSGLAEILRETREEGAQENEDDL